MDRRSALSASLSDSWEERAAAAEALATMDDPEADVALASLLDDEDLAVIQRGCAALLANPTTRALRRFTASYAVAGEQVGMSMNDVLVVAAGTNPDVRPALKALADAGDPGAVEALDWLR